MTGTCENDKALTAEQNRQVSAYSRKSVIEESAAYIEKEEMKCLSAQFVTDAIETGCDQFQDELYALDLAGDLVGEAYLTNARIDEYRAEIALEEATERFYN